MQFGRLGAGFGRLGGSSLAGLALPRIRLSASSIAEDAAGDTEIGTASVANAPDGVTYTWAITADPDSKFSIVEATGVLSLATLATLNYENATSHQVTIEATPSAGDPPPPRTFTIDVTNVLEVTLNALTLDTNEIEESSAAATVVGALQDVTSGSTLSLIDDAGGRFALSGTNIIAGLVATDYESATSHNITVRETHPDATTVDSVIAITVTDVDETAPTLSSPTAVEDGGAAADLSVSTNEANGTLYWVVTTSATAPSAAQVKAGNDHTGAAAADSGSQAVSGTGVQNATASGLTPETTYYTHFMHEDAGSNQSNVASSASFTTDAQPVANVVIFAGQSNMVANGTTAGNLPANLETATDQYIWTGSAFDALDNAQNNNEIMTPGSHQWGPEAEFGRQWQANIGTPLYIIKYNRSGTSLAVDWNPPSGSDFVILDGIIDDAITALEGADFVVNVRGFFWMQGESDATSESQANAYETNLTDIIAAVRAYGSSSTRSVIGRIYYPTATYRDTVRAAQAAVVAADVNAALVDTDGYVLSDTVHYDVDSTVQMGLDFFTAYNVDATVPDAFEVGDWSTAGDDTEIDVTINSLPGNGGSALLDVEYRLDGGSWVSSGGLVSFTITGLNNDQEYDVELRAVNVEGNGAASDVKAETPTGPTVPAAFSVGDWSIAAGDEEADVTISSLPSNGGSAITDIDYRLDGGSWVSTGGTTSFTIAGLTNDQEYDVELRAVNAVGDGAASDVKQVTPVASAIDAILLETGDTLLLETTDPVELDASIPAQSSASALTGDEWTVIVQGGTTKKIATLTVAEYING